MSSSTSAQWHNHIASMSARSLSNRSLGPGRSRRASHCNHAPHIPSFPRLHQRSMRRQLTYGRMATTTACLGKLTKTQRSWSSIRYPAYTNSSSTSFCYRGFWFENSTCTSNRTLRICTSILYLILNLYYNHTTEDSSNVAILMCIPS